MLLGVLLQVRELCAVVEKAHGMAPGWLLSAPHARVSDHPYAPTSIVLADASAEQQLCLQRL